jgi:hypothetical protein
MVDPSAVETASWSTISDVMTWARFGTDMSTPTNVSFLALLGIEANDDPAPLALVEEGDWQAVVASWTIATTTGSGDTAVVTATPPTIFQAAKAGLVGRAIRIKYGLQLRASEIAAHAAATALGSQIHLSQPPVGQIASSPSRKVKLAQVADQTTEDEVPLLDVSAVSAAYARYDLRMGGIPPEEVEPSLEQLTALHYIVFLIRLVPYLDYAIFGPHATRSIRRIRLSGLVLSASGALIQAEQYGPANFDQWSACSGVTRAAFIMLDIMTPSAYDVYADLIRSYATRYGPRCWPLLYQADTRARRELAERVHRKLDRSGALLLNGVATLKPWDAVYRQMVEEYAFWRREVEDPAMLILTSSANSALNVAGDAPVATRPSEHIAAVETYDASHPAGKVAKQSPVAAKKRKMNIHKLDASGLYTANRSDFSLCPKYQLGTCSGKCPDSLCHQCSKCLSSHHGLQKHDEAVAKGGGGHGGGKGKGKDKGGKHKSG